jgi:transposase
LTAQYNTNKEVKMTKVLVIELSQEQQQELEQVRDKAPKAYMRERAAALLKIAEGRTGRQVALKGLLKARQPDTIYRWVARYRAEGVGGLSNRPGRGRKPAFFPRYLEQQEVRLALLHLIRREPSQLGYQRSRWSLAMLLQECDWLQLESEAGLSQLLKRLKIRFKQAREYVHSPDPDYWDKLSLIELARLRAYYEPERFVLLYLDELSYYRWPSLAPAYEALGSTQPLAAHEPGPNTAGRIVATLEALTGQVCYQLRSRIRAGQLSAFYAHLSRQYPQAETIYVVQDNWPVHFHPDVLARLQPQQWPYPFSVPPHWSTEPSTRAVQDELPIQLLCLPTYASWCNPIEKLWRWLKQDILHLHRLSSDWDQLKLKLAAFLDQFQLGSPQLLRYVGLLPD